MRPIRFAARARREIFAAADWWRAYRPKAPDAFDVELERILQLIGETPNIGQRVRTSFDRTRRIQLRRVRYMLYYREDDGAIEVLSLWHANRGDDPQI